MRTFWLHIATPRGDWLRIARAGGGLRRPPSPPRVAANDDRMPVDSEICAIAIDLIADCGSEAATIANSKALDAFWRGDMPDCRFWTHAGRLIDSHFAGQCAQEYRRDLRDVIATLAI